jgi:signal transduction histidine kinase
MISKENSRLSRLIDNFLTFSRMERNRHAFAFTATPPQAIVQAAVQAMGERLEPSACDFRVDLSPDLPKIQADPDTLTTALINLLDNAWKYTPDQKQIVLQVKADGGFVDFAVTDNGIGMSRAAVKKIFQRFYQVDRRLSRSTGGCGLGLSIVKYIAEGHGGTIQVSSRPGNGSTFVLRVPTDAGARQDA